MEINYLQTITRGFATPPARVYLFTGGDDGLKAEGVERLASLLIDPASAEFDREAFDIAAERGDDAVLSVMSSVAGVPMFSEYRVVIVTNVQRLGKEAQETLAAGLARLCERSCLILVAAAPEYDGGRPKGKTLNPKLQTAVAKAGTVVLCDPPAPSDLKARAVDLARARGKTIDAGALDVLARTAVIAASDRGGGGKGGDLLVLQNELEKAIAYVGDRLKITKADALAVCSRGTEENIFALLDAVGNKNAARALDQVDELLRGGERPDSVAARAFVMLSRQLRMIWGAKYLGDQRSRPAGEDPQDILSGELLGLASRQSYVLRSLQEQSRKWTDDTLGRAVARVFASDMSLKGVPPIPALGYAQNGGADPAGNLKNLVVDLCEL